MTNKEQKAWRARIQQNTTNNYAKSDTLIKRNPLTDKRYQKRKIEVEIIDRPSNPEHERQMKILDNIIEVQKVNEERQFRNENIKLKQADNIFNVQLTKYDGTENQLQRFLTGEINQDDGRYHRRERWDKGIFYSMADFFNSETEADRKERYNKGIFLTNEEYSDMHPGW